MHVALITEGRDCNPGNHIEIPPDKNHIHDPTPKSEPNDRGSQVPDPQRPRSRCCPYDFDSKLCQVVNDRLLCGYNRNIGKPASDDRAISLNRGCRLRGGRLECGYEHGPFTNPRRPPGWDQAEYRALAEVDEDHIIVGGLEHENTQQSDNDNPPNLNNNNPPVIINEKKEELMPQNQKLLLNHIYTTRVYRSATKCVEIRDRVVCKGT